MKLSEFFLEQIPTLGVIHLYTIPTLKFTLNKNITDA